MPSFIALGCREVGEKFVVVGAPVWEFPPRVLAYASTDALSTVVSCTTVWGSHLNVITHVNLLQVIEHGGLLLMFQNYI